jgi:hypothetical protein
MTTYCSDALEQAMMLAQTKAMNSYSFRDCLNYLNYVWRDIYQRLAIADDGYYSKTIKLKNKLTKIPPYVMDTVQVYQASHPAGRNRRKYREASYNDLRSRETYRISGFDLWCEDAARMDVWCNYVPQPKQLFFTKNNRDPRILDEAPPFTLSRIYNLYNLETRAVMGYTSYVLVSRVDSSIEVDISGIINRDDWQVVFISCDYPYIFVSYRHKITGDYCSYLFDRPLDNEHGIEYNPFAYTGRSSNVEYVKVGWNDYTGMGVVVLDHNDDRYKEMGFTPDTELDYPIPEMYRLLVARLAEKFAAFNESTVMGVANEAAAAQYAFDTYARKNKSTWGRIENVTGPTWGDYL